MSPRAMASLVALVAACSGDGSVSKGRDDAATSPRDAAQQDDAGPVGMPFAFVASAASDRIQVYAVDPVTGLFGASTSASADGPSFLAYDPQHHTLYAAEESAGTVSAFSVTPTGALSFLNRVSSGGSGPVHVLVDGTQSNLLVANYGGGTASVVRIDASGALGDTSDEVSPGANAHQIVLDPGNRFAFVPSLGTDSLVQYLFDASAGSLSENAEPRLATAQGAGPRHLSFAPSGDFAYLISERSSTMSALAFDAETGRFTALQTLSTLPEGFAANNSTAEVAVHPGGRFLYGSNRGHDSIVSYRLASDGRMTLLAHTATGGAHPRHFSIDPSGRFLYVANRDSDSIHGFRIDPVDGALTALGELASIQRPQFVEVFYR